jgi:hypothetical protein
VQHDAGSYNAHTGSRRNSLAGSEPDEGRRLTYGTTGGDSLRGGSQVAEEEPTMEQFLLEETERLQDIITHMTAAAKEAEEEKSVLSKQLAQFSSTNGSLLAELTSKVAALEADNKYLEAELTATKEQLVEVQNQTGNAYQANPARREIQSSPTGTSLVSSATASPNQGSPNMREDASTNQLKTDLRQRLELEWIAREDKLMIMLNYRTRELQRVAELLAESRARNAEMAKLLHQLCTSGKPIIQSRDNSGTAPPKQSTAASRQVSSSVAKRGPSSYATQPVASQPTKARPVAGPSPAPAPANNKKPTSIVGQLAPPPSNQNGEARSTSVGSNSHPTTVPQLRLRKAIEPLRPPAPMRF